MKRIPKLVIIMPLLLSACAAPTVNMSLVKTEVLTEPEERIAPARAYLHFTQAQLKVQEGDIDGAIDEHKKAIFYDPKSSFLHASLAGLYAKKGTIEDAIREASVAVSLDQIGRASCR